MNLVKLHLILCLLFSSVLVNAQKKKVVFIIVDGIPADVIEKAPTPNLRKIAGKEGYTRAYVGGGRDTYSQTPTISAVGYNSLLTGTWVNKHNVWGNDIKAPNYNYWNIFRLLRAQQPQKKLAVFSTWTDNRTKLIGESLAEAGNLKMDFIADGYELDTAAFPHDKQSMYIHHIDEKVADEAAKCIQKDAPDLSWVYLEYSDDMGHKFGDSEQQQKAIEYVDNQVGRVWDAVEYRKDKFKEDWLIIITTDHGRDAKTGKNHGGQSDRERTTWMVTNAKKLNKYYHDFEPGIVDIMPTIAEFMSLKIPRERAVELDGVSFLNKISIIQPKAFLKDDNIEVSWKALENKGDVKVWLSTANHFAEGRADTYKLLGTVAASEQKASFNIKVMPSGFYKVVLEGANNILNYWIIPEKK